jgi:hypothetical protein
MNRLLLMPLIAGANSLSATPRTAGEKSGSNPRSNCQIVVWGSVLSDVISKDTK